MKCTAMSGNGVRTTGLNSYPRSRLQTPRGQTRALGALCAAVRGTTAAGSRVLPAATGSMPITVTTTLAFVLPWVLSSGPVRQALPAGARAGALRSSARPCPHRKRRHQARWRGLKTHSINSKNGGKVNHETPFRWFPSSAWEPGSGSSSFPSYCIPSESNHAHKPLRRSAGTLAIFQRPQLCRCGGFDRGDTGVVRRRKLELP